ncbi:hypothetical protein [Desulfurobacterium crinifex]
MPFQILWHKFKFAMEVVIGILILLFIAIVSIGFLLFMVGGGIYFLLSLPERVRERKIRKVNRKYLKKRLSYLP